MNKDVETEVAQALSIAKDARRDINRVAIASEERHKRTAERVTSATSRRRSRRAASNTSGYKRIY